MFRLAFSVLLPLVLVAAPLSINTPTPGETQFTGTTIEVTVPTDDFEVNGNCTLREAVRAANLDQPVDACPAGAGADTIALPLATYTLSIYGTYGVEEDEGLTSDLDIFTPISLVGTGPDKARIEWIYNPESSVEERVLHVLAAAQEVALESLSIQGGMNDGNYVAGVFNAAQLSLKQVDFTELYYDALANTGSVQMQDVRFFNSRLDYGAQILNEATGVIEGTRVSFSANHGDGFILYNHGELTLQDSQLTDSHLEFSPAVYSTGSLSLRGVTLSDIGGIYADAVLKNDGGRLLIEDSLVRTNYSSGGIIINNGDGVIRNTVFAENGVRFGPGVIYSPFGPLRLEAVTIRNNYARHSGMILHDSGRSPMVIVDSTIADNFTWGGGATAIQSYGALTIINTTISGNRGEENEHFPALYLSSATPSYLDHVTITGNLTAREYNSGPQAVLEVSNSSPVSIHASIIAGNQDGSGVVTYDCQITGQGKIISLGYNLIGSADLCGWTPAAGDQIGTLDNPLDPRLGPLADNGGPTLTHALLPGSPALDAADPDDCPPTDQRGVARPQGPACDIGAYEAETEVIPLKIDIQPANTQNLIPYKSNGLTPVAILGDPAYMFLSEWSPEQLAQGTLTFGRTGDENSLNYRANRPDCKQKDVNRDGLPDLVCFFRIRQTNLQCGDAFGVARLRLNGYFLEGRDRITVTPCK